MQFIKNSIVTKKIVKSADKAEADWVYNYPYAALEEALANAVYHRGYDIREAHRHTGSIYVFDFREGKS